MYRDWDLCFRDEDMQSVASLMSMGKADIGNLDDLEEEEEEPGVANHKRDDKALSSQIKNITSQLDNLEAHHGNPFEDDADEDWACDSEGNGDSLNPFGIVGMLFLFASSVLEHSQWRCLYQIVDDAKMMQNMFQFVCV